MYDIENKQTSEHRFKLYNALEGETYFFRNEDEVDEYINEQEIIYYSVAMNYLIENDCSLSYSLELAHDMGYSAKNLNSELLATIHHQDQLRGDWSEIE